MSLNASNEVWARSQASRPGVLVLLLAIAEEADDWGYKAGPSLETLAPKCRCDPRTVIRLIQAAEDQGELIVLRNVNQLNQYQLTPGGQPITPRNRELAQRGRGDKMSLHGRQSATVKLPGGGDIPNSDCHTVPIATHVYHDDDDALARAFSIIQRLEACGIEGTNRQRLAALYCQFVDGLDDVNEIIEQTVSSWANGQQGRGAVIRAPNGLIVRRLQQAYETRTGALKAWAVADERLRAGMAERISDKARAIWLGQQRAAAEAQAANAAPVLVDGVAL
jgi:hypothetical protein